MIELTELFNENVNLIGPQENIHEYFKSKHILLHFALQEGLPNVVIEAMANGCIPVVRRLPGIEGFLIEDKKNGFLFDTVDEAIEIILNIKNDNYDLEEIAACARSTIGSRFSMKNTAKVLVRSLHRV